MAVQQSIEDEACGHGGDKHSDGGQHHTGTQHGSYVAYLGVEASRKQDGAEGHRAHHLRQLDVVEVDAQSVAAKKHAHAKEK